MDKFEKLKAIIRKEYEKKQSEIEEYYLECKNQGIPHNIPYRKQGWRDSLDYLLSEIELIEAGIH